MTSTLSTDPALTPEQRELQQRAAAFVRELLPYEDKAEEHEYFSEETLVDIRRRAVEAGFVAMGLSKELGGRGMPVVDQTIVWEQLGALSNHLWSTASFPYTPMAAVNAEQRERYLEPLLRGDRRDAFLVTEPQGGSDPRALSTQAVREDGGFRINGEKCFASMAEQPGAFLLVLAQVAYEGPTFFIVEPDAEGVSFIRDRMLTARSPYRHPDIAFKDVFVEESAVLGAVGEGLELAFASMSQERTFIAVRVLGSANRALHLAVDWARERETHGRRLIEHQMVGGMLADSAAELAVARSFVYQLARELDAGLDRKTAHAKAGVAKLVATESAFQIADRCMQVFGGRGCDRANPVERIWRDLRVERIWEGTNEIQRLIVINELDKRGLDAVVGTTVEGLDLPPEPLGA
jgi:acyl-CoA dehydrogenase